MRDIANVVTLMGSAGSNPALSANPRSRPSQAPLTAKKAPMSTAIRPQGIPNDRRAARGWKGLLAGGLATALVLALSSCGARRYLNVTSEPPGAQVRLDEDLIGRTPLEFPFEHYGDRRLSLYLSGYSVYSERLRLKTPWHARFPFDIFTEVLLPLNLKYEKDVHVVLDLDDGARVQGNLSSFVERAEAIRDALPGQGKPQEEPQAEPAGPDPKP